MTVRASTGVRNSLLDTFGGFFADGAIAVYDGPQPGSADDAPAGVFLGYISKDGLTFTHGDPANGLEFDVAADGSITKDPAETWRLVAVAAGTARYARFVTNATDPQTSSTTQQRLDFTVGITGGNLQLSQVNFVIGQTADVTSFKVNMAADGSN